MRLSPYPKPDYQAACQIQGKFKRLKSFCLFVQAGLCLKIIAYFLFIISRLPNISSALGGNTENGIF